MITAPTPAGWLSVNKSRPIATSAGMSNLVSRSSFHWGPRSYVIAGIVLIRREDDLSALAALDELAADRRSSQKIRRMIQCTIRRLMRAVLLMLRRTISIPMTSRLAYARHIHSFVCALRPSGAQVKGMREGADQDSVVRPHRDAVPAGPRHASPRNMVEQRSG